MPKRFKKERIEGKLFTIRAYCTDCKSMLLESNPLTKKELLANWDQACLSALQIPCESCNHRFPNTHIYLRIHDKRVDKDYNPSVVLPKPKNPVDVEKVKNVKMSDYEN